MTVKQVSSDVRFRQLIMYDRSTHLVTGDLYVGTPLVLRAILVIESSEFDEDRPYAVFITCNTPMRGRRHASPVRFARLEDAIALAVEESKHHKLRGDALYQTGE